MSQTCGLLCSCHLSQELFANCLDVKLGMPTAQLTGCGKRTGIYTPDRIALLISHWLFFSLHYVTLVFHSIGEFRRRP